jgi:hypothetical protein
MIQGGVALASLLDLTFTQGVLFRTDDPKRCRAALATALQGYIR